MSIVDAFELRFMAFRPLFVQCSDCYITAHSIVPAEKNHKWEFM
jgi:hypothetical protein